MSYALKEGQSLIVEVSDENDARDFAGIGVRVRRGQYYRITRISRGEAESARLDEILDADAAQRR